MHKPLDILRFGFYEAPCGDCLFLMSQIMRVTPNWQWPRGRVWHAHVTDKRVYVSERYATSRKFNTLMYAARKASKCNRTFSSCIFTFYFQRDVLFIESVNPAFFVHGFFFVARFRSTNMLIRLLAFVRGWSFVCLLVLFIHFLFHHHPQSDFTLR